MEGEFQGNAHEFKITLSEMRRLAAAEARLMEIADERGFKRRLAVQCAIYFRKRNFKFMSIPLNI